MDNQIQKSPTPTIEDYLGIIYTLHRDGEQVYGARLAELLAVTPTTVTITLQRMLRDGWISLDHDKKIRLTDLGETAAQSIIRRHMLTEWMLAKILKIPWSEIHSEADKIEHTISEEVEKSLQVALSEPNQCPHGNPMPGSTIGTDEWIPLVQIKEGENVMIRRIHEFLENQRDQMRFLEKHLIQPGSYATIIKNNKDKRLLSILVKNKNKDVSVEIPEDIAGLVYAELLTS